MANIIFSSARIDEHGNLSGGQAGDQTGKEVSSQPYYIHKKGWYCFRAKDPDVAKKLGRAMKDACHNDMIGYDQSQRTDVLKALQKYGSLRAIAEPCEADCSSLVRACIIEATGKDPGNFHTGNESEVLAKTGIFEPRKTVVSSTALYIGDILVTQSKGHTGIITDGGEPTAHVASFPKCKASINSIVDGLIDVKADSSFDYRKKIAMANGIQFYSGSAEQNKTMLKWLKAGTLKKP